MSQRTSSWADRRRSRRIRRHVGAAAIGVVIFWFFWQSRPQWSPDMRFWKAVGDAAYGLLWLTVFLGPAAKLWPSLRRFLSWRRQLGIWSTILATFHALLIINGWAQWSVARFFGYEFVPQLGRLARMEPGFGLANVLGLSALFVALVLAATSSDRALKALSPKGWKFLHNGAYFVFYVGSIHALYFLFIHYTLSFHKRIPEPDWFRFWMLGMVATIAAVHVASFVKTVQTFRSEATSRA